MSNYETVIITKPDLTEPVVTALKEKMTSIVSEKKGTLTSIDDWGKRKLAYIIKKEVRGNYYLVKYSSTDGTLVPEIERNLRINESVLRYMTVKLEAVTPKKKEKKVKKTDQAVSGE